MLTMTLRKFSAILALAEKHHGASGMKARLADSMSTSTPDLDQSDDRFLAGMTKAIFSSGFSWEVVEQKWPGFEEAFDGFDPHRVAFYADKDVARLLKDSGIIRNGAKIQSTIANARFTGAPAPTSMTSPGTSGAGRAPRLTPRASCTTSSLLSALLAAGRTCSRTRSSPVG